MSDDLIRRKDVLDVFEQHWHLIDIMVAIKALPSAQPEWKKGKWIPQFDKWGDYVTTTEGYKCSECGEFDSMKDNFCPNCGAEMECFGKTEPTFGNKSEK